MRFVYLYLPRDAAHAVAQRTKRPLRQTRAGPVLTLSLNALPDERILAPLPVYALRTLLSGSRVGSVGSEGESIGQTLQGADSRIEVRTHRVDNHDLAVEIVPKLGVLLPSGAVVSVLKRLREVGEQCVTSSAH